MMAEPDRLRVGVVLDRRDVRRWQETAVSELQRSGVCELVLLDRHSHRAASRPPRVRQWLYHVYERADRSWFGSTDDPLARVELDGEWSPASDPAAVATHNLDVVLCLAPEPPAVRLAGCARFGAWSLEAEPQLRAEGDAVNPVTLRAHTSTDGGCVIDRSFVQHDPVSLHRSRCTAWRRAARLPARALRDLHRSGWSAIPEAALDGPTPPRNTSMARVISRTAGGVIGRRVAGRLGERQWFIAYRRLGAGPATPLTSIMPPPGRFYADPFLFRRDGRRFVFFEDYDWSRGQATICYLEIDERGSHSAPQLALRQDCHLSYPFVFADGDDVYMLPETAGHRTVELYRAARFPDQWMLERVLLRDVSAADPTLLRHDGRLWLFVAIDVDGGRAIDELFLFSSDSLEGEWTPHPMNPIVSDVRRARPAGRIVARDGELIRPAQDCSHAYGWRLVFNRIEALTATEYREQPVSAIEPVPGSGNLRTHSYDSDGEYEVVDGFRVRRKVPLPGVARRSRGPRWHRVDLESPVPERSPL